MTTRGRAASAGKVVTVCLGALAWARPGAGETGPCELMASSSPKGAQQIVTPCMYCGATGYQFLPCRTCRGRGWHPSR